MRVVLAEASALDRTASEVEIKGLPGHWTLMRVPSLICLFVGEDSEHDRCRKDAPRQTCSRSQATALL